MDSYSVRTERDFRNDQVLPLLFIGKEPAGPRKFSDLCKIFQLLVAGLENLNLLLPNAAVYSVFNYLTYYSLFSAIELPLPFSM